ncbi:MAG: MAPEG family protein [Betaproteobacteria bacterium]|nr:MAPEG family protein [Betaproteobacteria bacterium]
MSVPITALYAGLCALVLLALAARVIRLRWALRVGIGDGGERALGRAIRVHGNAVEYVPIALVLLLIAELDHASPALLHACGGVLVAARVLHAVGLSRTAGASWPRMVGTTGTAIVIAVLAVHGIAAFFA